MIVIKSAGVNEAWISTFQALVEDGSETGNEKYLRDEVVLIEIAKPEVVLADKRFPMAQTDLDVINKYIYSGDDEAKVVHEWTKLYYHRAFDNPNSQIEFLINLLY